MDGAYCCLCARRCRRRGAAPHDDTEAEAQASPRPRPQMQHQVQLQLQACTVPQPHSTWRIVSCAAALLRPRGALIVKDARGTLWTPAHAL